MSITPHEINTMRESICNAHGRVVTFGLGLGYFAYMVSLKEEVKEVVVVEKDNKVISLFNKYLLPLFPHKEKIKIVKEDAFHFFERKMNDTPFDYAFIDIYHTASDALPLYLRFKRAEKNIHTNTEFSYWIEESILCLLRRYVLTLIEEYYQGLKESDYDVIEDEESLLLHVLYQALKEEEFNNIISNFDKNTAQLALPEARKLVLKLEEFKHLIVTSARDRQVYTICRYVQDLASEFHSFYNSTRVITDDKEVTKARLSVIYAFKTVLATALGLICVNAPEKM
jgi:hypothetical protein